MPTPFVLTHEVPQTEIRVFGRYFSDGSLLKSRFQGMAKDDSDIDSFFFFWLHPWHKGVPRQAGIEPKPQQ